jgi:hypothetical protein
MTLETSILMDVDGYWLMPYLVLNFGGHLMSQQST